MTANELRERFLRFFAAHNHKIYPSDALVPKDDATLLFTSAGMNQFKQEFLGKPTEFRRRATCQRCLRTGDLDKVGKTNYHHTFFEMLGNFSFGEYFKEEAIQLAWQFVTEELHLPLARVWVSVYQDDQETYKIWREKMGVPSGRLMRLGAKDNFWPSNAPLEGPNGPCGPCSEIFYDQGEAVGCGRPECSPACDCGRFVECWNLVFTQFERKDKNKLEPLPHKNIDTGMGLERMAAVLEGVLSNFDIDIFSPITDRILHLARKTSAKLDPVQLSARNAIADHVRAVTFAVADGIVPSNDERGYVIRKLIRRAIWHGRSLGIQKACLHKIVPEVIMVMQPAYPELGLAKKKENITGVILAEEKRFQQTLERAVSFAEETLAQLDAKGEKKLPGDIAFKLYDTYGLPLEMLEFILSAKGVILDEEGFKKEMEKQRITSRKSSVMEEGVFVQTISSKFKLKATEFAGDNVYACSTSVQAMFSEDEQPLKKAEKGTRVKLVLQCTPFYGESGGQTGDSGIIKNKDARVEIVDAQKIDDLIVHIGKIEEGIIKLYDNVEAEINIENRKNIARNHTATHLLQAALRKVLGAHVRQSGSWVGAEKLRFDFTHFQALTARETAQVEELVNREINSDQKIEVSRMSFKEAQHLGALAFFGEKYAEEVRVIKIADTSLELCGGTHVASTGEIERFKIISESSVASGIRRIEAITARHAQEALEQNAYQRQELIRMFGTSGWDELLVSVKRNEESLKSIDKKLQYFRLENFKANIDNIVAQALQISGVKVIVKEIESADMFLLRQMLDLFRQKTESSVIVLASVWEEKALIVCTVGRQCAGRIDAAGIVRAVAQEVDGSGGGRSDFAQAGGKKPQGVPRALAMAQELIQKELK
ncbi:MAG: alanine--tRNA ligase [Candidatus Omnitrophota bacterium]